MTPLCWSSSTHQEMLKICLSSGHNINSIFPPSFFFHMNKILKLILSGLASLNRDYFVWQTLDFGCTFSSATCVFKRRSPLEREKKWVIELQKSILVSLNSFENSLLYVYCCLELARAFGKHKWKWAIEPEYCTRSSSVLHPRMCL